MKKWIWSIALIIIVLLIGGVLYSQYKNSVHTYENPVVTMEIADYGTVKIELYPDMAPNTVRNFISLINKGFYNGLTFHRVEDILIQGGDKEGTGASVSEYTIEGEFKANGYEENKLKFERGTIGMARQDYSLYYYYTGDSSYLTQGYNSAGTQFFIMTEDEEYFNDNYAAFGKVIEGIEVVDAVSKIETKKEKDEESGEETETTTPVNAPVIKSMTVETYGVEYREPEKVQ